VNEVPRNRRQVVFRVATLFALVAVLAAFAFWFPFVGDTGDTEPLNPNDIMGLWAKARPAQKRATAELLLSEMQRDGKLNLRTEAALAEPGGKQKLIAELVAALDASADRNRTEYMSPSLSITFAATRAATQMGWGQ
jgi:hypothetical protein